MHSHLRILTFLAVALVPIVGCGSGNDQGPNRVLDGGGTEDGGVAGDGGELCSCPLGEECNEDGACVSICGDVAACVRGAAATCCPSGTMCDSGICVVDCGDGVECNGACCGDEEMCFEDACVAECANPDNLCGVDSELCCTDEEACIQEQCIPLGEECDPADPLDLTCAEDEICEYSTSTCISRDLIDICEFRPPVGEFSPELACRWTAPVTGDAEIDAMDDVVQTPSVLNLTDDNGDGITDALDTPEIVFISFNLGIGPWTVGGCCTPRSVVRVVSGECNDDGTDESPATMNTLATLIGDPRVGVDPDGFIGNSSGIALGNLDGPVASPASERDEHTLKNPEIVATFRGGGAIAWRRTADDGSAWEIMWQNDTFPTSDHTMGTNGLFGGAQPLMADLNADGLPEVVIGNAVLNGQTGAKVWDGLETATSENPGIGNNAFVGPVSAVADIDLLPDGRQEVIAGNTVYAHDGTELWTYEFTTSNSICAGNLDCDGFNAVGNFDEDDEGEVVIVREGEVFVINHDGPLLHQVPVPMINGPATSWWTGEPPEVSPLFDDEGNALPTEKVGCGSASFYWPVFDDEGNQVFRDVGGVDQPEIIVAGGVGSVASNESGPPTVADFDGDGLAEIGTASSTAYVVIDFQCTGDPLPADCTQEWVRWMVPNDDCSSRATGSSVFDFEGDGIAEVIYADETTFRIFSGVDGTILFEDATHSSNTRVEMPLVVDVDNDNKSEIIVPEPNNSADNGGIDVWKDTDNNWVRTRRVWNQHAYSVTNITEDGQIPAVPEVNWLNSRLNNFRQNVQPGGLFDAPDFVVRGVARKPCGAGPETTVVISVGNDGALSVPDGIDVHVTVTLDGETTVLGTYQTQTWLVPGGTEEIEVTFNPPSSSVFTITATVDDDGEGNDKYNECIEGNNTLTSNPITACGVS